MSAVLNANTTSVKLKYDLNYLIADHSVKYSSYKGS